MSSDCHAASAARVAILDAEANAKERSAISLFLSGHRLTPDDPVTSYLAGCGAPIDRLRRPPRGLRYHPDLWCAEAEQHYPAMLAAVASAKGGHVATHRTWLDQRRDGSWGLAPLRQPMKLLGSLPGGSVRLWRGASDRPMSEASRSDVVVIACSIEAALALAIERPRARVLACLSLANMAAIDLPPAVVTVILCGASNPDGHAEVERAAERFRSERRRVYVAPHTLAGLAA